MFFNNMHWSDIKHVQKMVSFSWELSIKEDKDYLKLLKACASSVSFPERTGWNLIRRMHTVLWWLSKKIMTLVRKQVTACLYLKSIVFALVGSRIKPRKLVFRINVTTNDVHRSNQCRVKWSENPMFDLCFWWFN